MYRRTIFKLSVLHSQFWHQKSFVGCVYDHLNYPSLIIYHRAVCNLKYTFTVWQISLRSLHDSIDFNAWLVKCPPQLTSNTKHIATIKILAFNMYDFAFLNIVRELSWKFELKKNFFFKCKMILYISSILSFLTCLLCVHNLVIYIVKSAVTMTLHSWTS